MKDREYQCIHYVCEGECDLGKEATFRKHCQTCKSYRKKQGSAPARKDTRREKEKNILEKENKYM